MTKQQLNFQDSFLNQVRKEGQEIKVVMMNGASIIGVVKGFDNFTVMLQSRNAQHLMYKHAIAQMISRRHDVHKPAGEHQAEADHAEAAAPPARAHNPKFEGHKPPRENKSNSFNPVDLSGITATADNKSQS